MSEILRRPGHRLAVERTTPAGPLGDVAVLDTTVPPDAEVDIELVLESIPDGIVATGSITTPYVATCRRCLELIEGEVRQDVREIFETEPTEGETYQLGQDNVDLEPLVRDVVLLGLPPAPLCSEDCRGPVPDAFDDGESPDEPDPRWAELGKLDFDR